MTALVSTKDLCCGYSHNSDALTDVTFNVDAGQTVGILGPNGGGKTTLFRALFGELPVSKGTVHLAQRPAYVPQTHRSRLDFPVTAFDVALMGAYARTNWYRRVTRQDREKTAIALGRVGLNEQVNVSYGALSGGQRQRVLLARALIQESSILFLDEPLSGVDIPSAELIEHLLVELRNEGRAILVATHDINQARRFDQVLCLNRRQIAYGPSRITLDQKTLKETYGDEVVILDDPGATAIAVQHHDH